MRYHLTATVSHGHLCAVPNVWFNAGITSVGSGRGQNGMSTVPVVSAARLRDKNSFSLRRPDAAVRVKIVSVFRSCFIAGVSDVYWRAYFHQRRMSCFVTAFVRLFAFKKIHNKILLWTELGHTLTSIGLGVKKNLLFPETRPTLAFTPRP